MHSSKRVSIRTPIYFNEKLAQELEVVLGEFADKVTRQALSDEGLNPNEYATVDDLERQYERTDDSRFLSLAQDARKRSTFAWNARQRNGTRVSSITKTELLALPNHGKKELLFIELSNKAYDGHFECEFNVLGAVSLELEGPYEIVESTADRVVEVLRLHTSYPEMFDRQFFGFAIWLLAMAAILVMIGPLKAEASHSGWGGTALLTSVAIFFLVPLSGFLPDPWQWVFRPIDVQVGAGIRVSEHRRTVRKALMFAIGLPILINLVSSWISH